MRTGLCAALLLATVAGVGAQPPEIAGCPVFPPGNIWSAPVDALPVDSRSADYVATIGANQPMHPDFGSGLYNGGPIGIPFVVVSGLEPRRPAAFLYADESDPGPYAVPLDAPIEGGAHSDGDRHALALDKDNCILYELFDARPQADGSWRAGSGAIFDLRSHRLRPDGWTSADAAGLPILPGLVRFEEVAEGEIRHAIRFTARETRRAYVWPGRHYASRLTDARYPPMGQRFRLRANFDIAGFSPEIRVILEALKKYGMILADNGSPWYISGAPDERWNNERLRELRRLRGSDFEAVDVSTLMLAADSGATSVRREGPAVLSAASFQEGRVSPGEIISIFGNDIGPAAPLAASPDAAGLFGSELGGVRVLFDGDAAPLLYVSAGQINAVAPYALAGREVSNMDVRVRDMVVAGARVAIAGGSPAIFEPVLNEDYSPNAEANPAARGSVIILFGTGFGETDPAGIDGSLNAWPAPLPRAPVSVQIDGRGARVLYAGGAPSFVSGLFQINVVVPETARPGAAALTVAAGPYLTSPWLRVVVR
ncbi:MAG: hypothetical protein KIT09_14670 [Bryobacteraceae bacterium]|nr:hypothetical protein [Bryobacteraceae bacterium]